ncbi:PrsW family intramembrane metalloprotease [Romboutsia sp. Marseille-P6047]|uniref:PrsW family intramembrane metalloprotease n=1 Tax=Romboutsia sp. Marseille-P6047 TaxID=2161817 RepID=UPI000822FB62|nr:PrsW family glutamic-type intramembrane protease [Romboutsia sp. Marseille-P6047]SCH98494.1 Protease prsW [uncultured Clostridium sp.]
MKIRVLILAISPVLACLIWIYLKDRYDKEPIIILIKYFILGIVTSILGIGIERLLININILDGIDFIFYISFVVAGLTEESLKALILIPSLLKEKYFNEKLDGIIYSVFLSLGFATIENIIYILYENESLILQVSLSRAIISIPAHIMFAITMGYYIGKYKFEENQIKKRQYLMMSVLVPIFIHGVFDFILMIRYKWSISVFVAYLVLLWKINLDKLDRYMELSKIRFLKYIKIRQKKIRQRRK